MRSLGFRLGVALMLSAMTCGTVALAAPKGPAIAISKAQRDKGMAAAPGLITAGGLDCQLADARFMGEGADAKTKVKSSLYEVACTGNEGLLIQQAGAAPPAAFTCLEAAEPLPDGKPNPTACALPGNSDPKAGLVPYIAKTGVTCTPDRVRALGHSSTEALFELTCREDNGGYILQISAPPRLDKPIAMDPCAGYAETGSIKCTLTPRATQLAVIDKLVAQSGKPCAIKPDGRAFIGAAKSGKIYYEVACQDGKGFVLEQAANGSFGRAVDCAQADTIGGGCKLTNAREAKTEQASLYTQLTKKAGFACDVAGYAVLPSPAGSPTTEVVELKCSNRPDGGIALFASGAGKSAVYDCAHAELVGYRCSLTSTPAAYPRLTEDLRGLGKTSCIVASERMVGITPDKHAYLEVGCSDGLQGYMIEYTLAPLTPKTTIVCNDAKGIAGGCTLPGNTKKS